MPEFDPHLEEYRSLRKEIDSYSLIVAQLFIANATVTSALLGVCLAYGLKGHVYFSVFAILLPSVFYTASQIESVTRTSQYIRVFLEPVLGTRWETRLHCLRANRLGPRSDGAFAFSLSVFYALFAGVSLAAAFVTWQGGAWGLLLAAPLAGATAWGCRRITRACSAAFYGTYQQAWEEVRRLGG